VLALDQFVVRCSVLLTLLGAFFAAPLAQAAPPTEPSLRHAAPAAIVVNARPADDAQAIQRGLTRAVAGKRLTRAQAERYRAIVRRTRATLPGLPETRRITLARVLRLVRLQASRYNAPRALALFSMLDENTRFLKRRGLPASGTDVTGPDGVIYRAGWGYGLQFHPLANVGALNGHVAAGRDAKAAALAAALIARAVPRRGHGAAWEYYFPFGGGSAPWTSGMAQAVGAQALARAGKNPAARKAFGAIPGSLVQPLTAGPWIRLYDFSSLVVLNAQLQTVLSLREYAELSGNGDATRLANRLADAARTLFPAFDTGYWSRYSLGRESPLDYHRYVITLLGRLGRRSGQPFWENARMRFDGYTREVPLMKPGARRAAAYPWPADGFRDRVLIALWVSKISTVTVRVGGDQLRLGLLSGGWHRVWWSPGRRPARTFTPTVTATDLAGNTGSRPLAEIRIAIDTKPPEVKASVQRRKLTWRATDGATPWITLRLRLERAGKTKLVELGRHSLSGSLSMPLPRGTWTAVLVVHDSSGNRTRVPLGSVPAPG
jgi:D-glucuronyl C5-epimerase C-terminus